MAWDQKLKRLQENLGVSQEGLAQRLGLTTRTLSDLMKPGGRNPSEPVMRLIELLSGEQQSDEAGAGALIGEPLLNLVIIHEDWRADESESDPIDAILDLHRTGGRNNEYHYINVTPVLESKWMKWVKEGLMKRQVVPHFFDCPQGFDSPESQDCFFTATAMLLASKAMRRDLAHITLAADIRKFWPLARELRESIGVDVTIVREGAPGDDPAMDELLAKSNVSAAYPFSGRRVGFIESLKTDPRGNIAFGFICDETATIGEDRSAGGKSLFFSWNHMRKNPSGYPEPAIDELSRGDRVTFAIGVNHRGRCAVDVALAN